MAGARPELRGRAADEDTSARLDLQVEAMKRLGFMIGEWRGVGWTLLEHTRAQFEQEECVRSLLRGEIIAVEGRANDPGNWDSVRFTAFAIASYDLDTQAYSWRAYSAGSCIEVPLLVGERTCKWEFEAAPGVLMRFESTFDAGTWHEVGLVSRDAGKSWSQTLEMNLKRTDEIESGGSPRRPAPPRMDHGSARRVAGE